MKKQRLVEEYVKLVIETSALTQQTPCVLDGPFVVAGPHDRGEYTVTRDFSLLVTPEMLEVLRSTIKIDESDLDEGYLTGDHEITFDANVYYSKGSRDSYEYPGDPQEFLLEDITPVTINGILLTRQDAARVEKAMGELTEEENQNFFEDYID